jgi:hypothetical protein
MRSVNITMKPWKESSACFLFHAGFMLTFVFYPSDGRNVR